MLSLLTSRVTPRHSSQRRSPKCPKNSVLAFCWWAMVIRTRWATPRLAKRFRLSVTQVADSLRQPRRCSVLPTTEPRRRSEEHTSELQSLMRISYAVFCLKKQKYAKKHKTREQYED